MTVDSRRKLVFMSPRRRAPRASFIIDLKDPWNPQIISFQKISAGPHGDLPQRLPLPVVGRRRRIGLAAPDPPARASPVSVTDIRDPTHPFMYPTPFGERPAHRRRPAARRTASTSTSTASPGSPAQSGVRGYWTDGHALRPGDGPGPRRHPVRPDPLRRRPRRPATTSSFMHNAYHFPNALGGLAGGRRAADHQREQQHDCSSAGEFIIASLAGTLRRTDGARHAAAPRRRCRLATWSATGQPGRVPRHRRHDARSATARRTGSRSRATSSRSAYYEQGTRFIDVSDPANPTAGRLVPRPGARRDRRTRRRSSPATRRRLLARQVRLRRRLPARRRRPQVRRPGSRGTIQPKALLELLRRTPTGRRQRSTSRRRRRRHGAGDAGADAGHAGAASARSRRASRRTTRPSTTANVISTAGDAHAERRRPVARPRPATWSTARSRCRRRCRRKARSAAGTGAAASTTSAARPPDAAADLLRPGRPTTP